MRERSASGERNRTELTTWHIIPMPPVNISKKRPNQEDVDMDSVIIVIYAIATTLMCIVAALSILLMWEMMYNERKKRNKNHDEL